MATLDKIAIRNFLTIRYNPLEKPIVNPSTWKDFTNTFSDSNGYLTEKLLKNVISQMVEKQRGPFIVSLSSGIDSSLCLALLRSICPNEKIIALCGVFKGGYDESIAAREIATKFNADFKVIYMDSLFTNMPEIISISKKPRWNTYTHIIAKKARKFGKFLFTGDGADEVFGGYTFRYYKFMNLLRSNDNWKIKAINYLECHNRDWVPDQESMFGSSIKFHWDEIYQYFRTYFTSHLKPLLQVMLADFNGKLLFDFIPTQRAIFDHYRITGMQPFLDPTIIKFGLHLPIEQKYDHRKQKGKLVLRKIAKKLEIPHIDEKKGFSPELWLDWKDHGKKICQDYLMRKNSHIYKKKLINYNWVLRSFERVDNDGDIRYLHKLISILGLEIWYRVFITKEMKEHEKL